MPVSPSGEPGHFSPSQTRNANSFFPLVLGGPSKNDPLIRLPTAVWLLLFPRYDILLLEIKKYSVLGRYLIDDRAPCWWGATPPHLFDQ
jgi:hypothetical protein